MTMKTKFRDDKGAVAVFLALTTAFVLLTCGALAVDLGNAWARKRDVQRQVDVAALAASHLLPVTTSVDRTAIAQAVLDSMKLSQNGVGGQNLSSVTASTMLTSGLITFQHKVNGSWVSCPAGTLCTQMTVLAPSSRVNFGLAGAIGKSGVDVTKQAVVRVSTQLPITKNVMPFWLPNGCSFGPAEPDTTQGGGHGGGAGAGAGGAAGAGAAAAAPSSQSTSTATATATVTAITVGTPAGQHTIGDTNDTTVQTPSPTQFVHYTIRNIQNSQVTSGLIRFVSPDGSTIVDAAVSDTDGIKNNNTLVTGNFTIPPGVSTIAGVWKVYGLVLEDHGSKAEQSYSTNYKTLTVVGSGPTSSAPTSAATSGPTSGTTTATTTATATVTPTGIPVGCTGQDRGEFGQLESPRLDVANSQQALQYNIAKGLDHNLIPYEFTDATKVVTQCDKIANTQPAHQNDDVSRQTAPYNNCITGDTGNDGPQLYNGFISGVNAQYPGRLDTSKGAQGTTCPNGVARSDTIIGGVSINNDILSCYLRNGATLNTIMQDSGVDNTMLDGSITKSPRFIWLPVVYANDRTVKTWQPIKKFVPAFITDEEFGKSASATNGITVNGNSIKTFQVFTFNPAALPPNEQSPIVDYDPNLGNPIYTLVG
jgi:Flp pilus assembly protein TadG